MTTLVIQELEEILEILEAETPANPNAPANQRLLKKLEQELAKYFKALADAFPYNSLSALYSKYVEPD